MKGIGVEEELDAHCEVARNNENVDPYGKPHVQNFVSCSRAVSFITVNDTMSEPNCICLFISICRAMVYLRSLSDSFWRSVSPQHVCLHYCSVFVFYFILFTFTFIIFFLEQHGSYMFVEETRLSFTFIFEERRLSIKLVF